MPKKRPRVAGAPARTMLQDWIIIFCARKIFSVGISMPRSPRATMMASLLSRMSRKFCRPSWFSTLLMIFIARPLGPSTYAAPHRMLARRSARRRHRGARGQEMGHMQPASLHPLLSGRASARANSGGRHAGYIQGVVSPRFCRPLPSLQPGPHAAMAEAGGGTLRM